MSINRNYKNRHFQKEEFNIRDLQFISDIINLDDLKLDEFNLIASGCGTGKTRMISNAVPEYFNDYLPSEILLITSRSMIVDQQSQQEENIDACNINDTKFIDYLNGNDVDLEYIRKRGIPIMTYDKIIRILISKNNENTETLKRVKVVVIDECHTLFSDLFIQNIEAFKIWIRDSIYRQDKIFLGLTATPNIIHYYQSQWGVKINQLNKEPLFRYTAKQLICTNFEAIPYMVATNRLKGKTIIMCCSISDCIKLQDQMPNAALLVSKSNEFFKHDPSMKEIRESIVKKQILPDKFQYPLSRDKNGYGIEFEERKLEVLITTSTLREGINLKEESGVRNVVCCFQDELHITQFMGRCRYDIDNLVVVDTYIRTDNFNKKDDYIMKCHKVFKEYINNKCNIQWFDMISHLVDHDCYDVKRFSICTDEKQFINYINEKWLVPIGIKEEEADEYKIWKDSDKEEIINAAIKAKIFNLTKNRITFVRVVKTLINQFGYEIITGKQMVENNRHTYKLIISFDEEKITYERPPLKDAI